MVALCTPPQALRRKQTCYALQGPDAATELQMLAALRDLSPESLSLLPTLLRAPLQAAQADPAALRFPQQQLSAHEWQQRQPVDDIDLIEDVEGSQQQQQQQQPQASGQLESGDRAGADISADNQMHGGQSSQGVYGRGTLSLLGASEAQQVSAAAHLICTSPPRTQGVCGVAAGSGESRGCSEQTQASDESGSQEAEKPQAEDAASIIQRFGLNDEQAEALLAMERWSTPGASQVDRNAPSHEQCRTTTLICWHDSPWHAPICF